MRNSTLETALGNNRIYCFSTIQLL